MDIESKAKNFIFFNFVDANIRLLECFAKHSPDEMKEMSIQQIDTLCSAEKSEVKRMLNSNEMTMSRVIKDKMIQDEHWANHRIVYKTDRPDVVGQDPGTWRFKE